uniref:UDP-glucuronosyltransferase-like isoform X1 n=1 Tax=Doryrhamphus excisus TaxID=161450 RepID=UPI0025AE5FB7|nr:UDP-glucuronosyltransferase-like isoform X1 [Doryrhamphus excisus]
MRCWVWFPAVGLLAWMCCSLEPVEGGKVLVIPVDGSHWLSMKILVKELTHRGHDVVVVVPESSLLMNASESYRTQHYKVPYTKAELDDKFTELKDSVFIKSPEIARIVADALRLINFTGFQVKGCRALLNNQPLMSQLRKEGFNVVLTDPFLPCGSVLAHIFNIPVVYFMRGLPCDLDVKANQCPVPMSYVPKAYSGNTDVMTFLQRVKNNIMGMAENLLCRVAYAQFDVLVNDYVEKDMTYKDLLSHAALWLNRADFVLQWPKPLMPNMVFIGGINCAKARPLPADLEAFVEGSGEDGFIVFTLGSMVSTMPEEIAKHFFEAFAKIPQKVLWRYTGVQPQNVPKNVKLMKWLPQNDLLAHPKAKAFLTHGGTHGVYEGVCNAVPMLMFPLFGDQGDNVHRLVAHGVAESLGILDVTTDKLLAALTNIINDEGYKERMVKLSTLHLDRPVQPVDLAAFWTEFVMRHNGAAHLRVAAHDLNWFQYHSLDVIGFLLTVVVLALWLALKCCLFCIRKCCGKKTVKSKSE